MGKTKFADFVNSPEAIATNILTNRLKKLEQAGLVERKAYQTRPTRYEYHLTDAGVDTIPILQSMAHWALRHHQDLWQPPEGFFQLTPDRWKAWRQRGFVAP